MLGEYLDRFDADLPTQFIGLTGDQELIDQAQLSAGVPLAEDDGRLHSSLLLLYGTDDEAPVAFDAGNTGAGHRRRPDAGGGGVVTRFLARLAVVLLGLLGTLAVAGPASAHVGGGAAGSDFDGRIVSVSPEVPGVTVRILQFGDEFELVNDTSTDVLVPGYSDEPYLRIGPDGVWRNANSPATYLNLDRFGNAQPPARADASAEPDWQQVSTEPRYVWHDHRTHWMSQNQLPPAVQADPTRAAHRRRVDRPAAARGHRGGGRGGAHLDPAARARGDLAGVRGPGAARRGGRPVRADAASARCPDGARRGGRAVARVGHAGAAVEPRLADRRDRRGAAAGRDGGPGGGRGCPGGLAGTGRAWRG